ITFEYLDAELSSRGEEHRKKIGMNFQNAQEAYVDLENRSAGKMGKVRDGWDITSPISPLIENGRLAAAAVAAAAAATPPAATTVAPTLPPILAPARVPVAAAPAPVPPPAARTPEVSPEAKAFGNLLLRLMNDRDLNRSGFATLINQELPKDQPVDIQTVRRILSGQEPVSEALLEIIETIAIDQNPQINDKDGVKKDLRQAWEKARAQQGKMESKQTVDSADYHGFGETVAELFEKRHLTDPVHIAKAIREQTYVLKPAEPVIDSALIQKIFDGEHLPSPGLAAALRRVLGNPQGFDDAYQEARSAKPQQPKLSELREKIKKHFTDLNGTLGLNDIGEAGGIGTRRNVGSQLGRGVNVIFTVSELKTYRANLSKWMKEVLSATDIQVSAFQRDWDAFSAAFLEDQQKRQAVAGK
ncbi:MAG: hypothetical protein ACK5XN_15140, partial [Bacteroidota bacterium]